MKYLLAFLLAVPLLAGCGERKRKTEPEMVSISGYNYTGRYIDTFSVNGQWGGNLYETSAGGSGVCCILISPATKVPFDVKVEWTLNDTRDFKNGKWIPAPEEKHVATVSVHGPIPTRINSFEVHFLPDGSVKAFVTDMPSDPLFTPEGKPIQKEAP